MTMRLSLALLAACAWAAPAQDGPMERSFWLSLTLSPTVRGYWTQDPSVPQPEPPTAQEIAAAAEVLTEHYGANRLYLLHHGQCEADAARDLLRTWKRALAGRAEVAPTFLPMDYSQGLDAGAPVFSSRELTEWAAWCDAELGAPALALYDVCPNRPWDWAITALRWGSDLPIGQVGIQPEETPKAGLAFVVVDTWGGVSAYRDNQEWLAAGAETLRRWVRHPRPGVEQVFDLICVAWDYDYSEDGGTAPPYDDDRDDPLPTGRNRLAASVIAEAADPALFRGFSSDLIILQAHALAHGEDLYGDLRAGAPYRGLFAEPLEEIAAIYHTLR